MIPGAAYRLLPKTDEEIYYQRYVDLSPFKTAELANGSASLESTEATTTAGTINGTLAARSAALEDLIWACDTASNRLRLLASTLLGLGLGIWALKGPRGRGGIAVFGCSVLGPLALGMVFGVAGAAGAAAGIAAVVILSALASPPRTGDTPPKFFEIGHLYRTLVVIVMAALFPAIFGLALRFGPLW